MSQSKDDTLEADALALAELLLDIFEESEANSTIIASDLEGANSYE